MVTNQIPKDEARASVDRELDSPVSDKEWEFLVERDYIRELEEGTVTAAYVAGEVKKHRSVFGGSHGGGFLPAPVDLVPRLRALGVLFASRAANDPTVKAIRSSLLPSGLISPEDIGPWVGTREQEPASGTAGVLQVPGRGSVIVWSRSALGELAMCADRLGATYHWRQEDALEFLLAGVTPSVQWASAIVKLDGPATRISLTVDPETSPRRVMALYVEVRRSIQARRRIRPMTEKAAELARFGLEHPAGSWQSRMARWNAGHSDWAYSSYRNFSRDVRAARKRLESSNSWIQQPKAKEVRR